MEEEEVRIMHSLIGPAQKIWDQFIPMMKEHLDAVVDDQYPGYHSRFYLDFDDARPKIRMTGTEDHGGMRISNTVEAHCFICMKKIGGENTYGWSSGVSAHISCWKETIKSAIAEHYENTISDKQVVTTP